MNKLNLVGKKFGDLNVIEFYDIKDHDTRWKCRCACGKEVIVVGNYLTSKHTKSCGCLKKKFGRMKPGGEPAGHPNIKDIYWATGIYEGEGTCSKGNRSVQLFICQKDIWILNKLKTLFGGNIGKSNHCHQWHIHGARARGFLMTIYCLLSPRRQEQVRKALGKEEI